MKKYLTDLSIILDEIDSNPVKSLQFFTTAMANTNITNKPVDNCRTILITEILHNLIYNKTQLQDPNDIHKNTDDILRNIDNKYQKNQHFCWRSHEHHFHKTFEEYVNCPITCLCEISEYLDKLNKECYGR
jgi:hypothetical protein